MIRMIILREERNSVRTMRERERTVFNSQDNNYNIYEICRGLRMVGVHTDIA